MRSRTSTTWVATLAIVLSASYYAQASIQVSAGGYVNVADGLGGQGGAFNAQGAANSSGTPTQGDAFVTFCVELTEHVSLPGTYYVQALSTTASQTGNALTDLTRTIYSQYLGGSLPVTGMPSPGAYLNNTVQMAIWKTVMPSQTEGQLNDYIDGSGYDSAYYATLLAISPISGLNVSIMNLRSSSSPGAAYNQDLLVPLPPGVTEVPEAASLLVWSLLVSSAAVVAGRRRAASNRS